MKCQTAIVASKNMMKKLTTSSSLPSVTQDSLKKDAALEAARLVRDGMVIGIGTGSTVRYFIDALADLVKAGVRLKGVPTSRESAEKAREAGIEVDETFTGQIDLDVDGADEIDENGNLIKGGGGALLREKIVAYNSRNVCIIADSSKLKPRGLGEFRVPVEVIPYLSQMTRKQVEKLGGICIFRGNGSYVSDNGNQIMDCDFGIIKSPSDLENRIKMIPGVVEVGIFTGLATISIIAGEGGTEVKKYKTLSL